MTRQATQPVREGDQNIGILGASAVENLILMIHGFDVETSEPDIIEETPGVFVLVE